MKTPSLLIAASLGFWGLASGNLIAGLASAGMVAAVPLLSLRWQLRDDEDFARVAGLTAIIFFATGLLLLLNVDTLIFLKTLVIWLPPVLLPMALAQLSSGREKINLNASLRWRRKQSLQPVPLDFRIFYLAIILISSAMANNRSPLFFPTAALLFFWGLFANRGRSFSSLSFLCVFLLAVASGYGLVRGAESVHDMVREKTRLMMRQYFSSKYADPFQTNLSFGAIGRLKLSGEIILRLQSSDVPPSLLRLAGYESYLGNAWHGSQSFEYLPVGVDLTWALRDEPEMPGRAAIIEFYLPKEKGLLPSPYGSYQVAGETIYELEYKDDGSVRVVDGAPLITYEMLFNPELVRLNDLPSRKNLAIPDADKQVLDRIISGWQLTGLSSEEKVKRIQAFFADNFTYSLTLSGKGRFSTALENFLVGERKGYCEQFATATALLLRNVGVPSRYVTGFAVSEKSSLEGKYIVRERHAHAWSEAFVDGHWQVVDTTPADWFGLERRNRSSLEWLSDIFAFLKLRYAQFRIQTEQKYRQALSLAVVILAAFLIFRIYRRMKIRKISDSASQAARTFKPAESPFLLVEQKLLEIGIPRQINEPLLHWAERISEVREIDLDALQNLFELHLKRRFDPAGLTAPEMRLFQQKAEEWLAQHARMRIAEQERA